MLSLTSPIQLLQIFFTIGGSVLLMCFALSRFKFFSSIENTPGRYTHIDGLRGIAALFVFMCHTSLMMVMVVNNTHSYYGNFELSGKFGSIGVQIFFCITGFLFTQKMLHARNGMDWGKFFAHRIKRLLPLYLFAVTTAILFAYIVRTDIQNDISHTFINILKIYTFGFIPWQPVFGFDLHKIIGNIWTLTYEWRFYLLMPVFFWFIKDNVWRIAIPILLVIAILDLSASQFAVWPFFMGGIFTAFLVNAFQLQSRKMKWIATLLALIAVGIPLFNNSHFFGLQAWILISVGFALIILGEPSFLKYKTLRFLGEISYSVYLLGVFFSFCVFYMLRHSADPAHMSFLRYLCWETVISLGLVPLCALTFRYIEYPFLRKKASSKSLDFDVGGEIAVGR